MAGDDDARDRRRRRADDELADAIERAWRSKFGQPTVIALVVIARLRRGEPQP